LGAVGRYTLVRPLGKGGMADVFLARTQGLEDFRQFYAVKRILPRLTEDKKFLRMFLDEARITMNLQHPNIVQVHDLDECEGQYYIVMEYVDGMDLRCMLNMCYQLGTTFPYKHTLLVIMEALKGLQHAHDAVDGDGNPLELVHQDISPSNILVSRTGSVKLTDFGVAVAAIKKWKTDPGEILGKYRYFAPELIRRVPPSRQSDIFALGAVLYEFMTGESLLLGHKYEDVLKELRAFDAEQAIDRDMSIPSSMEPILLKALAANPANRYADAEEFLADVTDLIFEERIRVSSTDFSTFFERLETAADEEGHSEDVMLDPPSLSLEVIDEPVAEATSLSTATRAAMPVDSSLDWRFPRGTEAISFMPGLGIREWDGRTLRSWVDNGHVGPETLVRFEGDQWRVIGAYLRGRSPAAAQWKDGSRPFTPFDFRRQLAEALESEEPRSAICWTRDEVVAIHLDGKQVTAIEGSTTPRGLLESLESDGLLTPTQAMVISHLGGDDEEQIRDVLIQRKLISTALLEAQSARHTAETLARMLGWNNGSMRLHEAIPPPNRPVPLPFDAMLTAAIRERLDEETIGSIFADQMEQHLRLGLVDPDRCGLSLGPVELSVLSPDCEGQTVAALSSSAQFASPGSAFRTLLLLLQFDLLALN